MPFILDLALEDLGGEELDLEIGGAEVVGGEEGGGDLPDGVGLLELDEPLVRGHAVAGLGVVVQHVHGLRHLDLQ